MMPHAAGPRQHGRASPSDGLCPPPHQAAHWTGRATAQASGLSLPLVQRIWEAQQRQPHRARTVHHSRDPAFEAKLLDMVGRMSAHAVVLTIDDKSQMQALDRTQPGLPLQPGRCATLTQDNVSHGTTTLCAALDARDGMVIGRGMQRHR